MSTEPLVSDLVLAITEASTAALAECFKLMFETQSCVSFPQERDLATRLTEGWVTGTQDHPGDRKSGFPHVAISAIFRDRLARTLRFPAASRPQTRFDKHLWGADPDRRLDTLFLPTDPGSTRTLEPDRTSFVGRTRLSAIVQHALSRSRGASGNSDRTRAPLRTHTAATASMACPSPFHLAQRILSDPAASASEAYARAAIRTVLLQGLAVEGKPLKLDYDTVSRALDGIAARTAVGQPSRRIGLFRESMFLCHYLAAQGILVLDIAWTEQTPADRIDRVLAAPNALFDRALQGRGDTRTTFRLHPDYARLPDPGSLLNELHGLPLPVEGLSAVFQGGLRFASGGDVVAAISGPFGAGKTSACLALAASLAPLGCRTLFLSCEEDPADIATRLHEAAPASLGRTTSLFRCVQPQHTRSVAGPSWFTAHKISIAAEDGQVDAPAALTDFIATALREASLFVPFRSQDSGPPTLPPFARPVIIVDGLHQLFLEAATSDQMLDRSLRQLIDVCRQMRAVFLFTIAENEPALKRLDYLCDLVLQLDRRGFDVPEARAERIFRILKSRRQPASVGAHVLHLSGSRSFRIKPNIASYTQGGKLRRWIEPDPEWVLRMSDHWNHVTLQCGSQTLVYGFGSSGKAGLALYLLHHRPVPASSLGDTEPDLFSEFPPPKPARGEPCAYESRILVVSFLYHTSYYRRLAGRIRKTHERPVDRSSTIGDAMILDVIALYPGNLTPEDFLAKVENKLWAAETRGLPYTGILIDGIHNVYVQFPALQADATFWPQLYGTLRRRGLNVITTHTDFELRSNTYPGQPVIDFEHARRRSTPLLSVIVSAADYVFELSAALPTTRGRWEYRLFARTTLGTDPPSGSVPWDRQACRLGDWQPAHGERPRVTP